MTTLDTLDTLARRAVGAPGTVPVDWTDGGTIDTVGDHGHYVTPGGRPVRYPNAYRRAYGKPIYVHSTRRVVAGIGAIEPAWREVVRAVVLGLGRAARGARIDGQRWA